MECGRKRVEKGRNGRNGRGVGGKEATGVVRERKPLGIVIVRGYVLRRSVLRW